MFCSWKDLFSETNKSSIRKLIKALTLGHSKDGDADIQK